MSGLNSGSRSLPLISSNPSLSTAKSGPPEYAVSAMASQSGSTPQRLTAFLADYTIDASNIEQRLKEIEAAFTFIKQGGNKLIDDPSPYQVDFQVIYQSMQRSAVQNAEHRYAVVQRLMNMGITSFLKEFWLNICKKVPNVQSWSALTNNVATAATHFCLGFVVVGNGSDQMSLSHKEIVKEMADDLLLFMVDHLNSPLLRDSALTSTSPTFWIIISFLTTLHNFAQFLDDGVTRMCKLNIKEVVIPYQRSAEMVITSKVFIILAFCLEENESQDKLVASDDVVKFLLTVLASCLESREYYSNTYGFSADEILDAINRLAQADKNKKLLVQYGALPWYVKAMSNESTNRMKTEAAQGIWTMAFLKDNHQRIKDEPGCLNCIRKLASSTENAIKKAASGALWKLEGEGQQLMPKAAATKGQQTSGHIMLSYNWGVQPQVLQIKDRLRKLGYKIWVDVEQMSGSTLEAMSHAVENAALVLIFYTEKYKLSNACRSEAEYAYQRNKEFIPVRMEGQYKPDGWLGILLGVKLFYDLTKPDQFEATFEQLLGAIADRGKGGAHENVIVPITQTAVQQKPEIVPPKAKSDTGSNILPHNVQSSLNRSQLSCRNWTKEEVKKWLISQELQKYEKSLSTLTGEMLVELAVMQEVSPDAYYQLMREDMKVPMLDLLKFNVALYKLRQ